MSIRSPLRSRAAQGTSLKTARLPGVGYSANAVAHTTSSLLSQATTGSNTKSAWREIISAASNTQDTGMILFMFPLTIYTGDNGTLYDIGTGASGSESVVVANLPSAGNPADLNCQNILIPIYIRSGTRVAYRAQVAASGSQNAYCQAVFLKTDLMNVLPTTLDVIGTTSSNSRATALSGSSGAYNTQITASTSRAYQSLILLVTSPSKTGIGAAFRVTLGVGPSGLERDICTFDALQSSSGTIGGAVSWQRFDTLIAGGHIPAGSRLAVKHNIASNPQYLEAAVIGVPYG